MFCSLVLVNGANGVNGAHGIHRSLQSAPAVPPTPAATPPIVFGATLEGYYAWNMNRPPDGNNAFRAYDVKTDSFALQQAAVVVDAPPSIADGRRYGLRVDLQFGEAVGTLQGNLGNEPRPDLYRNVWQAYGTYVLPVGRGLAMDFGKFASPLGLETNYAKDDDHFTRALLYNFLPFYHSGARFAYALSDRVTVFYMVTNGAQQTEDFNSTVANHGMVVAKLPHHVLFTASAYESPEPSGLVHILDGQLAWTPVSMPVSLGLDVNHTSSKPSMGSTGVANGLGLYGRVFHGAWAGAVRYEHLDDPGGLFGAISTTFGEVTATAEWRAPEGFLGRFELRRDWSTVPVFPAAGASPRGSQTTATVGLVWWIGTKKGAW